MAIILRPRVKICCISSVEEAQMAISYGASALGLVSEMPSGPGVITEEEIEAIAACVPPPISTFLLTSKRTVDEIAAQVVSCRTNTVQIVDRFEEPYEDLRKAIPGVKIVQVIHVADEGSIEEAESVSESVDAVLLDSGNPALAVKELGGTGRVHDWTLSRRIVNGSRCPVFLAGGLTSGNVRRAIEAVRPFGLDLCSSVRTGGKLDESKLSAFFAKI